MSKSLVSGLSLRDARADMSARAARIKRERAALAANKDSIQDASKLLQLVAAKGNQKVEDGMWFTGYGSINVDAYYSSDEPSVTVTGTLIVRAKSLEDRAYKHLIGAAAMLGFTVGETRKHASEYQAGLTTVCERRIGGVAVELRAKLELAKPAEGATCERVQVGTRKTEIEEPVYELRCH